MLRGPSEGICNQTSHLGVADHIEAQIVDNCRAVFQNHQFNSHTPSKCVRIDVFHSEWNVELVVRVQSENPDEF